MSVPTATGIESIGILVQKSADAIVGVNTNRRAEVCGENTRTVDEGFSASSYGFRPGRNAHQAVRAAKQYVAEGPRVVDMDLEKFFDRVNHDLLMEKLSRRSMMDECIASSAGISKRAWAKGAISPSAQCTPKGGG